jgi:hypothetical protein
VNLKNFAAEVSGGNVYKGAVADAGTSGCLIPRFGSSGQDCEAERSNQNNS